MPTLQEWEQALTIRRRVYVESSPQLIQQVQQRLLKRETERQRQGKQILPRKDVITDVPFFAPQLEIQIEPLYLLQRLGVVTTPAVENLADICSTWAYFRYLWAFEIPRPGTPNPTLRLSPAARNIDFHQKGLLSDQIGVGMAAVLVGDFLSAPLAADVSVAMNDPLWPIDLQFDTSPDYLFFDSNQTTICIVECKGTQTNRSSSLDQLCRGTEQVPSLVFTNGRTPPSLIIATLLEDYQTIVFIIDPPDDEERTSDYLEKPKRIDRRKYHVRDDERFARATRLISEAKLLSYAGADEAAASKLERARALPEGTRRPDERETETRENEFGTFIGVRQPIGVKDRVNVEVFQALDAVVYNAILAEEPERLAAEIRSFQERRALASREGERTHPVLITHGPDSLSVKTAGPDGSLLEVRVSSP
jgi:hypothetical protein